MKTYSNKIFLLGIGIFLSGACQRPETGSVQDDSLAIPLRVTTFDLNQVKLLGGPFTHAMELDVQTLLNYEPDRLLAKFRSEAGLKPKEEHYHGWEDNTISGHSLGHYLSAISLMYRSTGIEEFKKRAEYIVNELALCQDANGDGFVGAFPDGQRIMEKEVAKGIINAKPFDLNGIWVPWYNIHKTMAGLRDAFHLCEIEKALTIESKLGDWTGMILSGLDDNQIQEMLKCEHGGINETLADLYADTGEKKYLVTARKFYQKVLLDSLAEGVDVLAGKHGNTNIPKLIGLARLYELTGDTNDYKAADFFWDRVVHHYTYVTGGNGDNEHFGQPDHFRDRLGPNTTETCNVYNMLKLTSHLIEWDGSAAAADFYERALFNHILSSQNPVNGRVTYNLSLEMGGFKAFQDPLWFTCCIGTGMENHAKYGRNIFYHNDKELFVSQFIASKLNWTKKGLLLTQRTAYPEEQATHLIFACKEPVNLTLRIRYPFWAIDGMEIKVNDRPFRFSQHPGTFVAIPRTWKDGDRVDVSFPFTLRLEPMPDDTNRVAIMYGALVMAGELGPVNDPDASKKDYVPVIRSDSRNPADWLIPVEGKPNHFMMKDVGFPRNVPLKPFYVVYNERYTVYWDLVE
ncbi:MAG: glycoside hydrolase family 127 protein [Bacteroidales bacterium]|nr:glycoside hydrolase family 127 protein [Bacteroidales bacterium]